MGRFVKGDVVVVPFPFSDMTMSKRRPAFVVADLAGDDLIFARSPVKIFVTSMPLLCMIVISNQAV